MVTGQPWSQEEHRHFPPAFKAAVRTLLLAHRRRSPASNCVTGGTDEPAVVEPQTNLLALVELELLLNVIRQAALPLSAWLPE